MRLMILRSYQPIIKFLGRKISPQCAFVAFAAVAVAAASPRVWAEDKDRTDSQKDSSLIGDLLGSDNSEESAVPGLASQEYPRGDRNSSRNDVLIAGDDSSLFQAQFAHAVFPESYDVELPPPPVSSVQLELGLAPPPPTEASLAASADENDILNADDLFQLLFPNGSEALEETEPSIEAEPAPVLPPIIPIVPPPTIEPFEINQSEASVIASTLGLDPRRARIIVQYRNVHGPFRSPEDLRLVTGINDSHLLLWEDMGLLDFD